MKKCFSRLCAVNCDFNPSQRYAVPTYSQHTKKLSNSSRIRTRDPLAKRPNKVCDPYGQNGKPMSNTEAMNQLSLLETGWVLNDGLEEDTGMDVPNSLSKTYYHSNYIDGARFASIAAAVAHNNNHYPSIFLERRLMKREKAWRVVTTIKCRTETLGGLSFNDFHIAMLIDVEAARSDVQSLLLEEKDSLKKHTWLRSNFFPLEVKSLDFLHPTILDRYFAKAIAYWSWKYHFTLQCGYQGYVWYHVLDIISFFHAFSDLALRSVFSIFSLINHYFFLIHQNCLRTFSGDGFVKQTACSFGSFDRYLCSFASVSYRTFLWPSQSSTVLISSRLRTINFEWLRSSICPSPAWFYKACLFQKYPLIVPRA